MSFFTNKKFLFKLIASICIFLTLFNFTMPLKAHAAGQLSKIGGQLLDPFVDLLSALGDGAMEIVQNSIMGTDATVIFDNTEGGWFAKLAKAIIAIVVAVAAVAVLISLNLLGAVILAAVKVAAGFVVVNTLTDGGAMAAISGVSATVFSDNIVMPLYSIGPEEIFTGRVLLFDPNIFDPEEVFVEYQENPDEQIDSEEEYPTMSLEEWDEQLQSENPKYTTENVIQYYYEDENGEKITTSTNNSAYQLKDIIAKWYYIIRNIAIIGLMLVLVYVGIRMLLTSIASEKAKYKQMLFDWVVAMCLVFVLHYFMVFANHFVDNLVSIFSSTAETKMHIVSIKEPSDKLKEAVEEVNPDYIASDGSIVWPTNMMGKIRVEAQLHSGESNYIGYALCYIVLVFYTAFFTFTYLKRLLYLMFLTVIAPLVALSYPIDKIRDGNAQAFEMWMKEYTINLLIQPFHLLLYIIFISMAFDLAGTNIIYSLVVIGFMIPAEKFLRKMFGFDKASSPGFLAGAGGAAMAITAVKSLANFASGGKGSNKQSGSGSGNNKIQQAQNPELEGGLTGNSLQELLDATVSGNGGAGNPEGAGNPGGAGTPGGAGSPGASGGFGASGNPGAPGDSNGTGNDSNNPIRFTNENGDITPASVAMGLGQTAVRGAQGAATGLKNVGTQMGSNIKNSQNVRKLSKIPGVNYAGARIKNMARRTFTKENLAAGAKKTIRGVAKYGLGATGAMLGAAAGIASGSPGDTLKYGIAGAYASSAIGTGMTDRIVNGFSSMVSNEQQLHDEAKRTQLGEEEYKKWKEEQNRKAFVNNAQERRKIAKEFNIKDKEQLDNMMNHAWQYKKWNVKDDKVMIEAMKLNKDNPSDINNIAAARFAQMSKDEKSLETNMKRYGKVSGVTQDKVNDMEQRIRQINDM